jgi:hypothetical protein
VQRSHHNDVEPRDRNTWVVDAEGKGLDLVIEVHVAGDRHKDEVTNAERYARLGIEEYFYFDRARRILRGHRLPGGREGSELRRQTYRPILPQEGRFASNVLGLELMLEGDRRRFFYGGAVILEADELIARLGTALNEALASKEEAERRALPPAYTPPPKRRTPRSSGTNRSMSRTMRTPPGSWFAKSDVLPSWDTTRTTTPGFAPASRAAD